MIVARRANVGAIVAVRRGRVCALAGIKALLLTQSSFKVSSRRPERKQSLPVLVLGSRERRLLLQQIAQQNSLLCVRVSLVAKPFLFCAASILRCCKLCSGFTQPAELRVHVQENLVARIFFGKHRFVFRDDLLGDIVVLLTPVPGLPGEECSYA